MDERYYDQVRSISTTDIANPTTSTRESSCMVVFEPQHQNDRANATTFVSRPRHFSILPAADMVDSSLSLSLSLSLSFHSPCRSFHFYLFYSFQAYNSTGPTTPLFLILLITSTHSMTPTKATSILYVIIGHRHRPSYSRGVPSLEIYRLSHRNSLERENDFFFIHRNVNSLFRVNRTGGRDSDFGLTFQGRTSVLYQHRLRRHEGSE